MKLGEALTLRARQATKLNDLSGRIRKNALVQEGEEAPENVKALMEQYLILSGEHSKLVENITITNARTSVDDDGQTLLHLIKERETLVRHRNLLTATADAATPTTDRYRYMRSELRYVAKVDVSELRDAAEQVSEQLLALDGRVQAINWQTDLIEVV